MEQLKESKNTGKINQKLNSTEKHLVTYRILPPIGVEKFVAGLDSKPRTEVVYGDLIEWFEGQEKIETRCVIDFAIFLGE